MVRARIWTENIAAFKKEVVEVGNKIRKSQVFGRTMAKCMQEYRQRIISNRDHQDEAGVKKAAEMARDHERDFFRLQDEIEKDQREYTRTMQLIDELQGRLDQQAIEEQAAEEAAAVQARLETARTAVASSKEEFDVLMAATVQEMQSSAASALQPVAPPDASGSNTGKETLKPEA